jgi:hypothetical protein
MTGLAETRAHRGNVAGPVTAREKITVFNLRHSLSTALVAARAAGPGELAGPAER